MNINNTEIVIAVNDIHLNGFLHVPDNANGLVIFAHGSGSGRYSERNQQVASVLNKANIATLLFDLLTLEEEAVDDVTREFRFNIELLAARLVIVTDWISTQPHIHHLSIGYFGASTGAGVALQAAAQRQDRINAIVSRGGRPDLASALLLEVKAPTLLIVGERDEPVIELNKTAMAHLHSINQLVIIPGATHLFEEAGTLDKVANLAKDWFLKYLTLSKI